MYLKKKLFTAAFGDHVVLSILILLATVIALPAISVAKVSGKIRGALWVANGTNVLEFSPSNLRRGVNGSKPRLTLNSATGFGAPQGVVFDTAGDLWVIDG
ncbi:MAG: hypothetical protein ACREQC_01135, partial [Candidatus Binataceae bacterium]